MKYDWLNYTSAYKEKVKATPHKDEAVEKFTKKW